MKTAILSVAAACTFSFLVGCNSCAEVEVLQPMRAAELKPMQRSWYGILPCVDCEGTETSLFLERDGIWAMNERYQGVRDEPSSFASYSTWVHTVDEPISTNNKDERLYCQAKGEALEMLDREGNPIESQFNYTFQPAPVSLPVTPMSMRGIYLHVADATIFADYTAGKRMLVANNIQLERGYLATRAENGQSILLTLEAHFMPGSNPDTSERAETLVADKDAKFIPGRACS